MVENNLRRQGVLIVVSGPSGAGKGTICQLVREKLPDLGYSVSATTRAPRKDEIEGKSYFFKSVDEFRKMIARGELLEYAEVYGNYYGTPKKYVLDMLDLGYDLMLEIDIQGAMQVKKNYPQCVLVFIVPPSLNELKNRLTGRGTDAEEVIARRLAAASDEIKYAEKYDYVVVNDVASDAADRMIAIMAAERNRVLRNRDVVLSLFE